MSTWYGASILPGDSLSTTFWILLPVQLLLLVSLASLFFGGYCLFQMASLDPGLPKQGMMISQTRVSDPGPDVKNEF